MAVIENDYSTMRVPEDKTVSGWKIAMINGVLAFGIASLLAGMQIGGALGLQRSLAAFLLAGGLLSIIASIVGLIGARNRLTSYMLTKFVLAKPVP